MNFKSVCISLTLVAIGFSSAVSAASPERQAAVSCAKAVQKAGGGHEFHLVKMTNHGGNGKYSVWLDAGDAASSAFCETRNNVVSILHTQTGDWQKSDMIRTRSAVLAKS